MLFKIYIAFCTIIAVSAYGFGIYECNETIRKDRIILSHTVDGQTLLKLIDHNQVLHY